MTSEKRFEEWHKAICEKDSAPGWCGIKLEEKEAWLAACKDLNLEGYRACVEALKLVSPLTVGFSQDEHIVILMKAVNDALSLARKEE